MDYDDEWDNIIKKSLKDSEYHDFRNTLIKICEELI